MTNPLANYPISQDGGRNTALIVANVKDSGGKYEFIALGEYIIGDINEVAQAIFNK